MKIISIIITLLSLSQIDTSSVQQYDRDIDCANLQALVAGSTNHQCSIYDPEKLAACLNPFLTKNKDFGQKLRIEGKKCVEELRLKLKEDIAHTLFMKNFNKKTEQRRDM